jgi:hypothetical protein
VRILLRCFKFLYGHSRNITLIKSDRSTPIINDESSNQAFSIVTRDLSGSGRTDLSDGFDIILAGPCKAFIGIVATMIQFANVQKGVQTYWADGVGVGGDPVRQTLNERQYPPCPHQYTAFTGQRYGLNRRKGVLIPKFILSSQFSATDFFSQKVKKIRWFVKIVP